MQLILLQKVVNLGNLGDKVDVKPGYGRNFLVPYGKAVPATAANVAEFEAKRAEYEAKAKAILGDAEGSPGQARRRRASPSTPMRRPKASCSARSARATSPKPSPPPATSSTSRKWSWAKARSATSASSKSSCTCTPTSRPRSRSSWRRKPRKPSDIRGFSRTGAARRPFSFVRCNAGHARVLAIGETTGYARAYPQTYLQRICGQATTMLRHCTG